MENAMNKVREWLTPVLIGIVAYFMQKIDRKVDDLYDQFNQSNITIQVMRTEIDFYRREMQDLKSKVAIYEDENRKLSPSRR